MTENIDAKEREFDTLLFPSGEYGVRIETLSHIPEQLLSRERFARKWCAQVVEWEYEKKDRDIYVAITANREINGWAKAGKFDQIAICSGLLVALERALAMMLSHPDIFPKVGNAAAECAERAVGYTEFGPSLPSINADGKISFANDPVRRAFGQRLTEIALHFAVMHEVGHLRNGHMELLQRLGVGLGVSESSIYTSERLLSHTLEFDADSYAAQKSARLVLNCVDAVKGDATDANTIADRNCFQDFNRAIFCHVFSVYILFQLFDTKMVRHSPDYVSSECHPPPRMRMDGFIQVGSTAVVLASNSAYSAAEYRNMAFAAMDEADRAIALISNKTPEPLWHERMYAPRISKAYSQHYDDFSRKWATIVSILESAKRGGVLAPR